MSKLRSALIAGAALLAASIIAAPASAQTREETDRKIATIFGEYQSFSDFFDTLKEAVGASNGDAVADLAEYPFTTKIDGVEVTFADWMEFANRYDELFSEEIVAAIEAQTYETLFVNQQGVMIGAGEVWFDGLCRNPPVCSDIDVRLIAVNQPEPEPPPAR